MSAENANPFILPGLGQSGDQAQNPLLAGMEMMRQAWQGMAGAGGLGQSAAMAAPMSLEDLDRRISDLRTVENWLRMNLSMLTSAIQGLEVQRATITTLRTFVETAAGAAQAGVAQSPLEAVLGIHKDKADAHKSDTRQTGAPASGGHAGEAGSASADSEAAGAAMPSSAQAWWNMLQGQFDTLAAATAATMRGAEAVKAAAQQSAGVAASEAAPKETAVKSTPSKARKSPAKRGAARKAPGEPSK
jgi:hypothetical protein